MSASLMGSMWWIVFVNGEPAVMTNAPTAERAENAFREMMLGHELVGTVKAKSIFEVEVDVLLRAYVPAALTLLTSIASAMGQRPGPRRS